MYGVIKAPDGPGYWVIEYKGDVITFIKRWDDIVKATAHKERMIRGSTIGTKD